MRRSPPTWDAVTRAAFPSDRVTFLHLLRHGEVETGGRRLAFGHRDLALSARGQARSAELLRFAAEVLPAVDQIWSSDLQRCRLLAQELGQGLSLPVQLDPELREQHMGAWEGQAWEDLTRDAPAAVHAWWADYARARPPGGESLEDLGRRVDAWWARVAPELSGKRVLLVTHIGVIRVLLCRALGLPLDQALRFAPGHGSHSLLLQADAGFVLQVLGEAPELAAGMSEAPRGPARRIALCGSAGTGKTTLGRALAEELDLPYIEEGMRRRLEGGLDVHSLGEDGFRGLLWELWEEQVQAEELALARQGGFVADRSPVDFAAFWLHYRFAHAREETEQFFAATRARTAALDRLVVLPWGVLPLMADGVRSSNPWLQRHFQASVEGLVRREVDAGRVLWMPDLTELSQRLAWVHARIGP